MKRKLAYVVVLFAVAVLASSCAHLRTVYDPIEDVSITEPVMGSNPSFSLVRYPDGTNKVLMTIRTDYRKDFGPVNRIVVWAEDVDDECNIARLDIPVPTEGTVYFGNVRHHTDYFIDCVECNVLLTPADALKVFDVLIAGWSHVRIYGEEGRYESIHFTPSQARDIAYLMDELVNLK